MNAAKDISRMGTLSYNTISYDSISYDVIRHNSQRNAAKRRAAIRRRRARRFRTNVMIAFIVIIAMFAIMGTVFFTAYAKNTDTEIDKYYVQIMVEEGDSLWSIAQEYMTDDCDDINDYIKELKRLNHISGDTIMAGYTLTVVAQK